MTGFLTTVFLGAVAGGIYALAAFGLVLTYRASGIFNFAHGAIGMLSAFVFYQLVQGGRVHLVAGVYDQAWQLPTSVALVLVVGVLAPAFGWWLDRVLFRRLRDAGEVVKIVATIGLLVALQGLAGVVWGQGAALTPTSIFADRVLTVGGFRANLEQVASVCLVLVLAVCLMAFLRFTPLGIRMRAVVDAAELAELAGVDAKRISGLSWAVGAGFAALAGILIVPFFGSLDPLTLTLLVIAAAAAAVVGRLRSFPLTLVGGLGIGIAQLAVQRYTDGEIARQLRPAIPFIVLFGVLFLPWWRRRPSEGTQPPAVPPPVRALPARPRVMRAGVVGVMLAAAPFVLGTGWHLYLALVPPTALIFLSLVLLSGYGGLVSLCQAALAGFGAFSAAHLVSSFGVPFPIAMLAGGLAAVPLGAFLAYRAASLSPLLLGLATLAFGAVMDEVLFTSRWFAGGLVGISFERPAVIGAPRPYYLASLGVFALFALLVHNLRRGKVGLALAGMRDSEVGLAAVGMNIPGLKFVCFCLSAFIAGLGGAMLAGATGQATPLNFLTFQSLIFLALAVVGGIGSWTGALTGALLLQLAPALAERSAAQRGLLAGVELDALSPLLFGLLAIALARNPHGLVELARAWAVRVTASRKERPAPQPHPPASVSPTGELVVLPNARLVHRSDCLLAREKQARPVTARTRKGLEACPLCEPEAAAAVRGAASSTDPRTDRGSPASGA